ncbi:MAG: TlpA family protein disulfide reductase [Peptococcaceae bacterium]|nr:TlpA family protein disulfide reductase [Peptococcaceae bacterium]
MFRKGGILAVVLFLAASFSASCAPGQNGQEGGVVREKPALDARADSGTGQVAQSGGDDARTVTAPDFTLADMEGRRVRLGDLRGKKVLINFWTTWCPYCRDEMPLLQRFQEVNRDKNWQVLTVNITSSEKGSAPVRSYIKANNYTFPVLLDENGSVSALYGVRNIPASFVLNEKGEVIRTKVGPFTEKEMAELGRL